MKVLDLDGDYNFAVKNIMALFGTKECKTKE